MFHTDYAILTDGVYPVVNDKTLIAIEGKLDVEESYSLNIVSAGIFSDRGCLLLTGKTEELENSALMDLPCIEFLLADVPDDVLEDIANNGASIVDVRSDIRLEFDMEVAKTYA